MLCIGDAKFLFKQSLCYNEMVKMNQQEVVKR